MLIALYIYIYTGCYSVIAVIITIMTMINSLQAASVAGNLMIKHAHHDFPSDVFTMTEAAGGKVEVYGMSAR